MPNKIFSSRKAYILWNVLQVLDFQGNRAILLTTVFPLSSCSTLKMAHMLSQLNWLRFLLRCAAVGANHSAGQFCGTVRLGGRVLWRDICNTVSQRHDAGRLGWAILQHNSSRPATATARCVMIDRRWGNNATRPANSLVRLVLVARLASTVSDFGFAISR